MNNSYYGTYKPNHMKDRKMAAVWLAFVVFLFGCGEENHSCGIESLKSMADECSRYSMSGNVRKCDSIARELMSKAVEADDRRYIGTADYYLGIFDSEFRSDSAEIRISRLRNALDIAREVSDPELESKTLNSLGIWEMSKNGNYALAGRYFTDALRIAGTNDLGVHALVYESNLSELCRLINDTIGYGYDKNLYVRARALGKNEIAAAAAFHCADYAIRHGLPDSVVEEHLAALNLTGAPSYLAEVLRAVAELPRSPETSERIITAIFEGGARLDADESGYCHYVLSRALQSQDRYMESDVEACLAISYYEGQRYGDQWIELMKIRAKNLDRLGKPSEAYRMMIRHDEIKDSVESIRNREIVNRLKIEHQVEKQNAEIRLGNERFKRLMLLSVALVALLCLSLISYYIYNRNRRRYYESVVRQYKASVEREEMLKKSIETIRKGNDASSLSVSEDGGKVNSNMGLTAENADRIFDRIVREIEEREIYRDPSITRDRFAETVGCNRTYFSETIKYRTGMSYTQYMNRCRVRKAMEILSTDVAISMKDLAKDLGFLSLPPFYSAFKEEVGMTPTVFRNTVKSLKK